MRCTPIQRRYLQSKVHPRLFAQRLVLTDGSTIVLPALASNRPVLKLQVDSLSHASWNPAARELMLNQQNPSLARFAQRFSTVESNDMSDIFGA